MTDQDFIVEIRKILEELYQTVIHVTLSHKFDSQYLVARCALESADEKVPQRVIVKKWEAQTEPNPYQAEPTLIRFWRELDTLAFLKTIDTAVPLGPRLIYGNHDKNLLILEDLGESQTVQDVLFDGTRDEAETAIIGFARELGRVHRYTYGHHQTFNEYTDRREAFEVDGATNIANQKENIWVSLQGMDIEIPDKLSTEIDKLYSRLFRENTFYTLVHADGGAHNMLVLDDDSFRLMDYEFARFANGFIDLACIRLGFPPAFHARRVPDDILHQAEQVYRDEISHVTPQATDDDWFYQMLVDACTHWSLVWIKNMWLFYLSKRLEIGPDFDTQDGRDADIMRFFRQKCFTFLEVTLEIAQQRQAQSEIHSVLNLWKAKFVHHFPDLEMIDFFPAFQAQ